jgi:hypothetical protein
LFKDLAGGQIDKQVEGLPCIMVNIIWWVHNNNIFRDMDIPLEVVTNHIISISKEFKVSLKRKIPWLPTMLALDLDTPWGFFDDASRGHPPQCRVGVVLYINQSHYMHIKYALGRSSNNIEKCIALWTLLAIAQEKGAKKL